MIDNDSSKSIRSIARNIGASEFLIRWVVHEDIQYFSYKMRKDNCLSQAMKNKRKELTAKPLNKLKHSIEPNMLWFFSSEKNFCKDQIVNSQNNCWLALSPQDVQILKTKYSVHIIMFRMVTSDGVVMHLFISPHGLNLNMKCLMKLVLTWIKGVAAGRH